MKLPWRRDRTEIEDLSRQFAEMRGLLTEVLARLPEPVAAPIPEPPTPPFLGQMCSKGHLGNAKIVCADASIANGREAVAWVGDDGSWALSVRSVKKTDITVAELRAVQLAIKLHPGSVTVYTDNFTAARACQFWLGIPVDNAPGATILEGYRQQFPALASALINRYDTVVDWSPRNQHPLNRAADQIAGLGTENPPYTAKVLWSIAARAAHHQAGVFHQEQAAGVARLIESSG